MQGQAIGVYMTREDYRKFGAAFVFSEACEGTVLTFDSQATLDLRTVMEKTTAAPSQQLPLAELRRAMGRDSSNSIGSEILSDRDVFQVCGS